MHSFKLFDAHCDTLDKLRSGGTLAQSTLHFNLPAARLYACCIQVMAVWIDAEKEKEPLPFALGRIARFHACMDNIPLLKTSRALRTHKKGPAFILSIEGGEAIESDLSNLQVLFDRGVRLITLTWNHPNRISDTAAHPQTPGGLTAFGKEVIGEMERLGMTVDVSHISEKGFWDTLEVAKKPVIASHSCSYAVHPHHRNLSDDQFCALCRTGGVVGINFYTDFLGGEHIEDIVRHIMHFLSLGGENHIGLGSDFDGIERLPIGICGVADTYKVLEALLQKNLPEEIVKKIAFGNMERYFAAVLPA